MTTSGELVELLDRLAALGGIVSAIEVVIATPGEVVFRHAAGHRVGGERLVAGAGARFDAASLTKPWAATLAVVLAERGEMPLPDLRFRHREGFEAWAPLAARLGRRLADRAELARFLREARVPADRFDPARALYGDLGFVLWGLEVEERFGRPWTALLDEHVAAPLGLAPIGALATAVEPSRGVECRLDNFREVELAAAQGVKLTRARPFLQGLVQDGNARALRAVGIEPAHAGLFVTADELLALGREWLAAATGDSSRLLGARSVAAALAGDGEYAFGWARWSEEGSSGPALSPASFGHTGFTGGSLWIDPERGRIHVVAAHRLSSGIDLNPLRREIHRLAAAI